MPRKNVRPLCGRPLLSWTIEAALGSERVDAVLVSSDDDEILQVARAAGAGTILRPPEISGDSASSEDALLHALDHLERQNHHFETLAFLQCTSPLTIATDVSGTVEAMWRAEAQTAFAAVPFHYFVWRSQHDETVGVNHDKRVRQMRQQREPEHLEAGAVYAMNVAGFREHKHRFFGRTAIYEMAAERRWEIDDETDFAVAEALLRRRLSADLALSLPSQVRGLLLDFDGVMTDNRVWIDQNGRESVACDRSDGWGLARLRESGVKVGVISTERNPVVAARCAKLGLDCRQDVKNKVDAARAWAESAGLTDLRHVIFVGNDLNDRPLMEAVSAEGGCVLIPADAHPAVKPLARMILSRDGGHGAVREVCDAIIDRNISTKEFT